MTYLLPDGKSRILCVPPDIDDRWHISLIDEECMKLVIKGVSTCHSGFPCLVYSFNFLILYHCLNTTQSFCIPSIQNRIVYTIF